MSKIEALADAFALIGFLAQLEYNENIASFKGDNLKKLAAILSMLFLVALPTGCAHVQAEPAQATLPSGSENLVNLCISDVTARMAVPEKDVKVISVFSTEFRDTSLGCPQPGRGYADVITPGYIIKLDAAGMTCEYHTDKASSIAFYIAVYQVAGSDSDEVEDCCAVKTT
jgi:hypothetical protein